MRPFDQVEYPLDSLSHRRASADPLAMVGASRGVVATGSFYRHRSVIVTHKEGSAGMEVLISDIRSSQSVTVAANTGETRAELIARAHKVFDQKYEVTNG